MKTVFILSGGGALGAFEVGALKFLLEPSNNIRPDIIVGTSVGSLNGAKLAERPDIYGIGELEQIWRGITGNNYIYGPSPGFDAFQNINPTLGRIIGEGLRWGAGGVFLDAVGVPAFGAAILGFFYGAGSQAAKEVEVLSKEKSLYVLEPFNRNLLTPMLQDRYPEWLTNVRNAGTRFRAVLVSMESGDLVYVSETGRLTGWGARITESGEIGRQSRHPVENVSLARAVLASSSEPIIHAPVQFAPTGDEHFYDGGIREIVPTRTLFDPEAELNLDPAEEVRIFVVSASLLGIKRWPSDGTFDTEGVLWPMEGGDNIIARTFDIVLNETLLSDVEYARLRAPERWEVIAIGATHFVHDPMTFIPDLLAINMGHGYTRACDVLRKAARPWTDFTDALVKLDLELYERVKSLPGSFRVSDLIREAYKYWKDREAWLRDQRWMIIPEEHVTFALQKVQEVSAIIGARRRANLPATSLAWECIGAFEYDWPEAQPQLLNPQISVLPSGLDFGQVLICANHPKRESLTVRNTGAGPLIITSFQIDGGPFSTPLPAFAVVKPNDTFSVMVHFAPTSEGLVQGMLSLTSDDPASLITMVQLKGTGISTPPAIEVNPQSLSLNFGRVLQNKEYTADFTLKNTGSKPLTINQDPPFTDPVFSIEEYTDEIGCLDSGLIRVKCMVSDKRPHEATIPFTTNDDKQRELALSVRATGSPEECEGLAERLAELKKDLAGGNDDPGDLLQQITEVERQMQQLGCPSQ